MLNQISKLSLLIVLAIAFVFTSCEKENVDELTSNFTVNTENTESTTDFSTAQRGGELTANRERGNNGNCLELVFPLSISYPDGTTEIAADQAALKELKTAFREANPDATERPTIVFPIQINQDDTIIDIADAAALAAAKEACDNRSGRNGRGGNNEGRGGTCIQAVYPLTYNLPDGTVIAVADKEEAKAAIMAWKEANPDAEERPTIAFPYNVQLQDSSIVAVTTQEEVAALKEACRGNRGDGDSRQAACFSLSYPYTIAFDDGTTAIIEDRAGKRAAIQAWKEANPDATERPSTELVFPLNVEIVDDSIIEIVDQAALDALKATCSDDGGQ